MLRALIALLLLTAPATAFPVARCINLGAAMEAPVEGDWGYNIAQRHITAIADAGFDTVRLPVRFSAHWDGTRLSPQILARTDQVIGWATAEGLNTILDLHHFTEIYDDPTLHIPTLIAIWTALSAHYQNAPDTLMFELFNEPAEAFTTALAVSVFADITTLIRARNPDRWIITGGGNWNDLDEMLTLPALSHREVHTFHYYRPWEFTHQQAAYLETAPPASTWGSPEDLAALQSDIAQAGSAQPGTPLPGNAQTTLQTPNFLGEFGVYAATDPAHRLNWIRATRRAAEANGIPWCYWGFTQGDVIGFSAYDTATENWEPGMLDALFD